MSDPELDKILQERAKKMMTESSKPESPQIIELTKANFDRQVGGARPVFVDFWAAWCGPCRAMEPVIERLAGKYSDKVTFGKLNVDNEPEIATRFDVQSIPTFMVFRNGQPADAVIGAVGEAALNQMVQRSLGGPSVYQ